MLEGGEGYSSGPLSSGPFREGEMERESAQSSIILMLAAGRT